MDNEIISFNLARIERGREKLCKCDPPHYEVDTVNRIVSCQDCGATVDAFDALLTLARLYELLEDEQRKMLSKAKTYSELADAEFKRMRKNKVFREMEEHYRKGLYPICPKCAEPIDSVDIREWTAHLE